MENIKFESIQEMIDAIEGLIITDQINDESEVWHDDNAVRGIEIDQDGDILVFCDESECVGANVKSFLIVLKELVEKSGAGDIYAYLKNADEILNVDELRVDEDGDLIFIEVEDEWNML